jgi:hypothetical protein
MLRASVLIVLAALAFHALLKSPIAAWVLAFSPEPVRLVRPWPHHTARRRLVSGGAGGLTHDI